MEKLIAFFNEYFRGTFNLPENTSKSGDLPTDELGTYLYYAFVTNENGEMCLDFYAMNRWWSTDVHKRILPDGNCIDILPRYDQPDDPGNTFGIPHREYVNKILAEKGMIF